MKNIATLVAAAMLFAGPAAAKSASVDSLSCIEKMFNDEQANAMAQLGEGDDAKSKAAEKKLDFFTMGMVSRMCANRNGWSENQYFNSVGYMMAWPTMRGLQLNGADLGYSAIERAWTRHAADWTGKTRLTEADIDVLLREAESDGLTPKDEAAKKNARRYADVLQQVAGIRADFAANRAPRSLKK